VHFVFVINYVVFSSTDIENVLEWWWAKTSFMFLM